VDADVAERNSGVNPYATASTHAPSKAPNYWILFESWSAPVSSQISLMVAAEWALLALAWES
jgi:hypothetical protein